MDSDDDGDDDDDDDDFVLDYFWHSTESTLQLHLGPCEDDLRLLSSTGGPTFIMPFNLLAQGELKMQSRSPKISGMLSTSPSLHKQFKIAYRKLG